MKKRTHTGKSPQPPRREAILDAAKDVFLDQGYELATMDAIAERAATTKRTVYAHFEHKQALFAAMVNHSAGLFMEHLGELDRGGSNYQAELERFANRFCELSTFRHAVQFQRLIIAESKRFPGLARGVSTSIQGKALAMVAIMVGQNVQAAASDARAETDHETLVAIHQLTEQSIQILEGQNKILALLQGQVRNSQG